MKKSIYLIISLFTILGLGNLCISNNYIVSIAKEKNYYATSIDYDGNIEYISYEDIKNIDTSVTNTPCYVPSDSLDIMIESGSLDDSFVSNPNLIFGDDDRIKLSDPSQYSLFPYRAICYIKVFDDSGANTWGTGVLVGPSTVLTACHVVYKNDKTWWDHYEIYPGGYQENGVIKSAYPTCYFKKITAGRNRETNDNADDWAIIDLTSDIGYTTGYFGVSSTAISVGSKVRLYGYHYDYNGLLGYGTGNIKFLETYKFYHDCDALAGSSGGPVTFGTTTVVGIHSGGCDDTQDIACKVSSYIVGWVNERLM